jgi:hypothetical protein
MKSGQRTRSGYVGAGLCVLLMVAVLLAACRVTPMPSPRPPTPTPKPPMPTPLSGFPSPGPSPEGLAWDGEFLWVVDSETRQLYQMDLTKGEVIGSFGIPVDKPKGVAWSSAHLWVVDEETVMIYQIDPADGSVISKIPAPEQTAEGPWSIEDLTWDGEFLWCGVFAGWCSSFNRIAPEEGTVVMSFFPECNPRGMTSDSRYLWTICYNGKELPSKVDRRTISEKTVEMVESRVFLGDVIAEDPTGLAFIGESLWITDRATQRIFRAAIEAK